MNRKLKLLGLIAVSVLSAVIFVGCSCKKEIAPISITVAPTEQETFVGVSYAVSYGIYPQNATNTSVAITVSNEKVITVDKNFSDTANGSINITTVGVGTSTVTFAVNGTTIRAVHSVRVYADPVALNTPANLRYNDTTQSIVFSSVQNASKYHLKINDQLVEVNDPNKALLTTHDVSYKVFGTGGSLTVGQEYDVAVRAVGDGKFFTSSTYGTYEENPMKFLKLISPQNITNNLGAITWDHNPLYEEGVVSYVVTVNDTEYQPQTENTFNIEVTNPSNYVVKVRAVKSDAGLVTLFNSEQSPAHTITKLSFPSNLQVVNNLRVQSVYQNSVFTWEGVEGATGYEVTVSPKLVGDIELFTFVAADEKVLIIDDRFQGNTTYTFSVKAVGNTSQILESGVRTYTFTKLNTVSNARLESETLYFDVLNITAQTQYEVLLTINNTTIQHVILGGSLNLTNIATTAGSYTVKIRSLAFHDVGGNKWYANSSQYETGLVINKLASPVISQITNAGVIYWNLVEHAVIYDVYYDNTFVTSLTALELTDIGSYNLSEYVTIEPGAHTVAIVAIGTGNNISSTVASKINYSFQKLAKPTNLAVANDKISWSNIEGAYYYAVGENSLILNPIGGENQYSLINPLSVNTIYVVAGGNNLNIITSDVSEFIVNKLLTPSNVRTQNGVLYFDYDANNFYKIYVNNLDLNIVVTNGTYNFATNLPVGATTEVAIKAFPRTDLVGNTSLSSDKVYINLNKLAPTANLLNTKIDDGSETYRLTWDSVPNAVSYRLVITPINVGDTSNLELDITQSVTYYNIPNNWLKGLYSVKVTAIGNSVDLGSGAIGYINSAASASYEIVRLAAPTNVRVSDGKVIWTASANPNSAVPVEYEVRILYAGEYTYYRTTQTSYAISSYSGNYTIAVRAIGPTTLNMTSVWSVSNVISKLNKIANLRVDNGEFKWDSYNTTYGTGIAVVYDLYLITNESGTRELLVSGYTQTSYILTKTVSKNVTHFFEVVARATDYINSDYSTPLSFKKLENITGFSLTNAEFKWNANTDALGYDILNTTNGANTIYLSVPAGETTALFNEGGTLDSGTYTFKIRAKGGVNNGNFINGDYDNTVTVTILSGVTGVKVQSGVLKWNLSYGEGEENNLPTNYEITIYEILEGGALSEGDVHTVVNTVTEFDLSNLGSGNYKIEIVSVGNTTDKISSPATVLELVTKIKASDLNLRVEQGVVMWDAFIGENVQYEPYLDGQSLGKQTTTTYSFTQLTPLTQYNFKILVYADGYLTSAYSNELTLVKLPQVQNFAINKNASADQPHFFSWALLQNAGLEIASGYEITPTTALPSFNGGAVAGESTLNFTITTAGTYSFRIRAVGSTNNSGISYLTSDYGSTVTVVVLDSVKNIVIQNNALTFTASPMFTDNNTTPDLFTIKVYSIDELGAETFVTSKDLSNVYSWDMKNNGTLLPAGTYVVRIYSVGSQNFKVTSAAAVKEDVVVLLAPGNLKVTNGLVDFELSSAEGILETYEVYLNGSLLLTITNNSLLESDKINKAITTTGNSQTLKLRAVATNAIYSVFSSEITISKLPVTTGMRISLNNNVSTLYWNNVSNASGYRLLVSPYTEALNSLPFYNATNKYFELTMSGTDGFALPVTLPPNTYNYKFIAVGNTTLAESGAVGYLTSNESEENSFIIMNAPTGLRVENGIIKWDSIAGATKYKLDFYATGTVTQNTQVFKTTNISPLQYDINTSEFTAGTYTLRVYALGDGISNISSTEYVELVIMRGAAPSSYKILNGYVSWTVTTNNILQNVFGNTSGTLQTEDYDLLEKIFKGEVEGISTMLIKNLWSLYNMEFTINGVKYISTPSSVQRVGNDFIMLYAVNLPSGSYNISVRGLGNTPANALFEGSNLSIATEENLKPLNYAYTLSTSELQAYKLASPVTPVYQSATSIVDDRFYWTTVSTPNSQTVLDYFVIATPKDGLSDSITDLVTVPVGVTTYSIDVREIEDELTQARIPAGNLYTIIVVARGTLDSTLNSGTNYLTSSYTNISEVEILTEPRQLKVLNGVITFSQNSSALYHTLKIWNNNNSYETAISDPANGLIKREIIIDSETLISDANLSNNEGIYSYNFENNALFPASENAYKITVKAVGNRITTISSLEETILTVIKWKNVSLTGSHAITIENGMFKWSHVKAYSPFNGLLVYPENYKVLITRSSHLGENVVTEIIYNVGKTTDQYIYFELPDSDDYPASIEEDGNTYYYSYFVTVSAYGSIAGSEDLQFATSNSVSSKLGQRLDLPVNLTTLDGVINWNAVVNAAGYDVYISELYLNNYEFIQNGNVINFTLNDDFAAGTYHIRVRANSNSLGYLNSRKSNEMRIVKLDTPLLRIQNGEVKWNNTDLPFAVATYTTLHISGPEGFEGTDLIGFETAEFVVNNNVYTISVPYDHVANTGVGLTLKGTVEGTYTIKVQYIGSNGSVNSGEDAYFLASSDEISFTFTKLVAPTLDLKSEEQDGDVLNYVEWNEVAQATDYNVAIVELENEVITRIVKYNFKTQPQYFTYVNGFYQFNLIAVTQYDEANPAIEPFGEEYFVYVEALADNSNATVNEVRYSLSNDSNFEAVAIPLTPSKLSLNEYGSIRWENRSLQTSPVLEISYLSGGSYTTPQLIELPQGTTSYNLTVVSENYLIRIKSINGSLSGGILSQSEFSDVVEGAFNLYSSGSGTESDPYLLTNAKHLFNINYYPAAHFKVMANLNTAVYSELLDWKPIGVANTTLQIPTSSFSGVLDGNGYTITSIKFTGTTQNELGFIHTIAAGGVVKNLTIHVVALNMNVRNYGTVAVYNYGTIQNVTINGSIHMVQSSRTDIFIGGAVSVNQAGGLIKQVVNNATITSNTNSTTNTTSIGGIVYRNDGTLEQVGNTAAITGTSVGGVAYMNANIITQSYNTGAITTIANVGYQRLMYVGGLVALNEGQATISYSYTRNLQNITVTNNAGTTTYVGGLIASNGSTGNISNSYTVFKLGTVTVTGTVTSGAIAGNSVYYDNNYTNVYYQDIGTTLLALGNRSGLVNGVTIKTETEMKQAGFVTLLVNYFTSTVNNYPKLTWQA